MGGWIFAFSQTTESPERKFKYIHSLDLDFGKIYPYGKEFRKSDFKNYLTFGINANFSKFDFGKRFIFYQSLGFNFAAKNHESLIDNLIFENGYTGGLKGDSYRTSFNYGVNFEFKIYKNFHIAFPINYTMRWWGYQGKYYLHDGQTINPDDIVGSGEASSANRIKFYKNFTYGISSGIDLVLHIGTKGAVFTRFNVNYFPTSLDIYTMKSISYNQTNGEFTMPISTVQNSTDIRFTFGIRSTAFRSSNKQNSKPNTTKNNPDVILKPQKGRK